ncbi:hypothetical protein Y1Q_0009835 [Alligator mississippiensis]|uniref:Uncharacterized protein n=1 Tax=Alligator mississippiensis TaxID=8496 RepID=A0A151MWU1_ALLMI|nr:hypothetical protein Y1Q_0009835 [Alligator mississippiensis]
MEAESSRTTRTNIETPLGIRVLCSSHTSGSRFPSLITCDLEKIPMNKTGQSQHEACKSMFTYWLQEWTRSKMRRLITV